MAVSPKFKLYDSAGEYLASCKYAHHAAAFVSVLGAGATVRLIHQYVLWTEASEGWEAGESYDQTAQVIVDREQFLYAMSEELASTGRRLVPATIGAALRQGVPTSNGLT